MKKISTILFLVMLFGICNAQTQNVKKNVIETHFGMTHYINYPALSVVEDSTPSYTIPSYGFLYGCRLDEFLFGVECDIATISTSSAAGNESAIDYNLSLLMRRYEEVNEKIELYAGILVGMDIFANGFKYMSQNYSNVRLGLGMEFSLGLNYRLSSTTYVGVHTGMNIPCVILTQKAGKVPASLNVNEKRRYNGMNISFNYGIRF